MSALGWAIGGWLLLNSAIVIALLNRRSRPALRERLFRWVIGERRLRSPTHVEKGADTEDRSDVEVRRTFPGRWKTISAKVLAALAIIGALVAGSVIYVSNHPRTIVACFSNCN
jgi:hypothetical protein